MIKEAFAGKGAVAVGGAVVFCGLTLYAAGQILDYLFRDVDPKRKEEIQDKEPDAIDTEEPITDPA